MKTFIRTLLTLCAFSMVMFSTNASAVVPSEVVTANCNGSVRTFNNYVLVPPNCRIISVVKSCPSGYDLIGNSVCNLRQNPVSPGSGGKKTSVPNCPPGYSFKGSVCSAPKASGRCPAGGYSASGTTCNAQASCPSGLSLRGSLCSN